MRKTGNIVLFILATTVGYGQHAIDSLKNLLASSKPDTNRVLLLSAISVRTLSSDSKSAMKYATEGLLLARALKFKKGEADCLRRSGIALFLEGNYPQALDIFQQALVISEDINDSFGIGAGLGHIGSVYKELGDPVKARSYYYRYLKITQTTQNKSEEANAWGRIGESFMDQGELDSAEVAFNNAYPLALGTALKGETGLAGFFNNMGKLQTKRGNNEEAMTLYRRGVAYGNTANSLNILSVIYVGMADLYRHAGKNDSCIFYALKGLETAEKNEFSKGILAAYKTLSEVYEIIDVRQAYNYQKLATILNDSLFNTVKTTQVHNLFFLEQQRQQAIETEKTNHKNQLRLYLLLSGLFVFLLVAGILYRNNRTKQKANNLLRSQKQEILVQRSNAEKALEELKLAQAQLIQSEKMASLGELTAGIAHEIQNPLNFVNNFSEVNRELIEELKIKNEKLKIEDDEVNELLDDIKHNLEKINHHGRRADAIVKGMLQHSKASTGKKELTDINKLADEYLRLSYHGMRAKDKSFNATMKTDFDKSVGKINIIPQDIGRIILNLINNAFYAVSEKAGQNIQGYEPTISLVTKKIADKVIVSIADNGSGIPQKVLDKIFQPFFTTKPTGQGTGLGLSLSYDIVKAHGGEIKVETKEGMGAEFIIQLPLK